MSVDAHRRDAARHHAVLRREPGQRSTRSAIRSMPILPRGDVRLTMGGEPTFVSIDDYRVGGVEHGGRRPEQTQALPTNCCAGCATASRPAACCITARASGIRANRCRAGRCRCYWRTDGVPIWRDQIVDRATRRRPQPPSDASSSQTLASGSASRAIAVAGLRGLRAWLMNERKLPVNVDPDDRSSTTRGRAPHGRSSSAARSRRLRAADAALEGAGAPSWLSELWLAAPRRIVSGAGRFADGLPLPLELAAAMFTAVRLSASGAGTIPLRRAPIPCPRRARKPRSAPRADGRARRRSRRRRSAPRAGARRQGEFRCARRSPSRRATAPLRVHAAAGKSSTTISNCSRPSKTPPPRSACRCSIEGYPPPHDPRLNHHQGDARPRRHRGQRPSGRDLARGGRDHHRDSTKTRGSRGSAPTSS